MSKNEKIKVLRPYPIIVGTRDQAHSRANEQGLSQQFIDRSLQKEISLSRTTHLVLPQTVPATYVFKWVLHFYTHPGIRHQVEIDPRHLPEVVDRLHALVVPVSLQPERRNTDWLVFHTFGLGGLIDSSAAVLKYLKRNSFSFGNVEKYLASGGIETIPPQGGAV